MKKLNFILLSLFALIISACSNKVDLYSDKGDSTVVYFMLDTSVDTNFVKITKSFIGNANELAQNYDACNYQIGEIDVKLLTNKKMVNGVVRYDTIQMYPIQKWIPYDSTSTFYSGCYQTYYYTTEKLVSGKEYNLVITRNDGVVVTSKATTIDNFNFRAPTVDQKINFNSTSLNRVKWVNLGESYVTNAAMFEVVAYFRYEELQPGATEWVDKEIKWTFGKKEATSLFNSDEWLYAMPYTPNALFNIIETDPYLNANSPTGVKRNIKKMRYEISAIGEELYNYMIINNSSSAIQDTPEYTNIENGIGLMSARVMHSQKIIINDLSRKKIVADFPDFGFVYSPNNPAD